MSERPLLSFCIPTCNRPHRVYECVKHILKYVENDIEVIVADNSDGKETLHLIANIDDKRLTYIKNGENIGFIGNVVRVLQIANGAFAFLLSDEDIVYLPSIPLILNKIKEHPSAGCIFGTILKDDGSVYLGYRDEVLPPNGNSLLRLAFEHAYLSGLILCLPKIAEHLNVLKEKKEQVCSVYPHMYLMNLLCSRYHSICVQNTFCTQGVAENDNMDIFNEEHFSTPNSRYRQLQVWLSTIPELTNSDKVKGDLYYKCYISVISAVFNIKKLISEMDKEHPYFKSYYGKNNINIDIFYWKRKVIESILNFDKNDFFIKKLVESDRSIKIKTV